jgi:hypothetical protein
MKRKKQGKPQGMTYADKLTRNRQIKESIRELTYNAELELRLNRGIQRALWLAVASVADAYGFGPERIKPFFKAFQENSDELNRMIQETDEDYAYEKLRRKAERVTGSQIAYLYEDEMLAAEEKHKKEGMEL